jgi:hypothetical protein
MKATELDTDYLSASEVMLQYIELAGFTTKRLLKKIGIWFGALNSRARRVIFALSGLKLVVERKNARRKTSKSMSMRKSTVMAVE